MPDNLQSCWSGAGVSLFFPGRPGVLVVIIIVIWPGFIIYRKRNSPDGPDKPPDDPDRPGIPLDRTELITLEERIVKLQYRANGGEQFQSEM